MAVAVREAAVLSVADHWARIWVEMLGRPIPTPLVAALQRALDRPKDRDRDDMPAYLRDALRSWARQWAGEIDPQNVVNLISDYVTHEREKVTATGGALQRAADFMGFTLAKTRKLYYRLRN